MSIFSNQRGEVVTEINFDVDYHIWHYRFQYFYELGFSDHYQKNFELFNNLNVQRTQLSLDLYADYLNMNSAGPEKKKLINSLLEEFELKLKIKK